MNKANDGKTDTDAKKPKLKGFAAMDRDRVRELAKLGGKTVHERGTGHRFTKEQAREAGRKGGLARHKPRSAKPAAEPLPVEES